MGRDMVFVLTGEQDYVEHGSMDRLLYLLRTTRRPGSEHRVGSVWRPEAGGLVQGRLEVTCGDWYGSLQDIGVTVSGPDGTIWGKGSFVERAS